MTRRQPSVAAELAGHAVHVRAYAKVNVVLEVLGRRPDGYHELYTILQAIGLYDELCCEPAADLTLDAPPLADDAPNLVMRAATALQEATGCQAGAALTLRKGIPLASGLGGGSADAAAALVALNDLWKLYLEPAELARIAPSLGTDVPFFLLGGTALARGRGDELEPLPDPLPRWLVILVPETILPEKTRQIYAMLDPRWYTAGGFVLTLAQRLRTNQATSWRPLGNGLEPTAMEAFPDLRAARNALVEASEQAWREFPTPAGEDAEPDWNLSGAGPALFTYFGDRRGAERCQALLAERGYRAYVAPTLSRAASQAAIGLVPRETANTRA
ncbi:MAG TPA: 4-(cytidine 5'-diphospho)-2-C-methyl-D-erythritol kinase [Chloroflexota bacterium]|nr:4-(cytidine 5'-diphospho)-2-C-methyl-D-erythritol kinase [Chloroflexota bacterium]